MSDRSNKPAFFLLALFITVVFIVPFVSSCGNGGNASSVGLNTQLNILNLSPNVEPVNLYIDFIQQGTSSYTYPNASGYFYTSEDGAPIQVRSAANIASNLLTIDTPLLANHKYSLFIVGLLGNASTDSLTHILTEDDLASTPNVGYGKVRFVNASIQQTGLDVAANGTPAFSDILFKGITNYIQLPAGNYNFQINPTGSPSTILSTPALQTTTIQDGRIYTLYSYGEVNGTDTLSFGASIITNR